MSQISIGQPLATTGVKSVPTLVGEPLTSSDYRFVYHDNPDRFFEGGPRPFRLIRTSPRLESYEDAVYIPAAKRPKQKLGCLYDAHLDRIDDSVTRRGLTDYELNTDPAHLSIDVDSLPVYDRPVLYLGLLRPHYGHYLMESLSYWWALAADYPEVDHFLFHVVNPQGFQKSVVRATLEAMNIPRERILHFDQPMRLRKVIVPESSFQAKSHIYTQYSETLRTLGKKLGGTTANQTEQPLYLSRTKETGGVRRYVGEAQVEAYLAEQGVRIIYPGQLPLHEQVKAVNTHKTIIGFQGSQMMNSMFSLQPKTVIHFTDDSVWPNTVLIDRCFDNDATYVKVATSENPLRVAYRNFMARAFGKKIKVNNFRTWHQVDHSRAIDWLKSSGLV